MKKEQIFENYITTQYSNYDYELSRETFKKKTLLTIPELKDLPTNTKVLELGCGMGGFAHICKLLGITDYSGVDLSGEEIQLCKKDFLKYKFYKWDIIEFLKVNKLKYDVIFMSQVFEHLTLEEAETILPLIYDHLSKDGVFINSMPNANSYYNAGQCMFNDITHQRIYNQISFSQLLKLQGFNNFAHRPDYCGRNAFEHFVHKTYLKLFELHLKLLGFARWRVYTHCIITLLRRNNGK